MTCTQHTHPRVILIPNSRIDFDRDIVESAVINSSFSSSSSFSSLSSLVALHSPDPQLALASAKCVVQQQPPVYPAPPVPEPASTAFSLAQLHIVTDEISPSHVKLLDGALQFVPSQAAFGAKHLVAALLDDLDKMGEVFRKI